MEDVTNSGNPRTDSTYPSASQRLEEDSPDASADAYEDSSSPHQPMDERSGSQNAMVDLQDGASSSAGGPGPVNLGLPNESDEDDDIEEDLDDYREDLVDIMADSNDESEMVSSDEEVGGSEGEGGEDAEEAEAEDPEETGEFNKPKEGEKFVGCKHYKRRCALICSTCHKPYTCRFCHDEVEVNHELDRKAVVQIKCLECDQVQDVQKVCQGCQVDFAHYFCAVCRLYDDEDKKQYHCDGCRICRIGGRENFFHCQTCDMCLANDMKNNHKCIEKMSRSNCPVCLEDLHTSRKSCRVPKCGHMLHYKCMQQLLRTGNYACPTCSVSMVDMSSVWEKLDHEVSITPMPAEYRDFKVQILCRDCHQESRAAFHILGQKCVPCGSYNTCRAAEPEGSCCSQDDVEAVEQQQTEAEDVAAAAVRELGLAANMSDDDGDDDDDETSQASHFNRLRRLLNGLSGAAHNRRNESHDNSERRPDEEDAEAAAAAGAAVATNNPSPGTSAGNQADSRPENPSDSRPEDPSDSRPSGAASAMAPLYQDLEDDELD